MTRKHPSRLAPWVTAPLLGLFLIPFAGCGETPPAEKKAAPAPAAAPEPPKTAKGKGKNTNPTSDMDRDEVRAFRKQQREQGKTP